VPALAFALAACNTGFQPQYRVADLRILALRSEVVEAAGCGDLPPTSPAPCVADPNPSDTVVLEALVANPQQRSGLLVRWFACAPNGTDLVPPCIDDAVLSDPESIATAPGVIALPAGEEIDVHPDGVTIRITIPLSQIPAGAIAAALDAKKAQATAQPTFQCSMFVEVPLVVIATAEGRRDVALKRVRLVRPDVTPPFDGYVTNVNPKIGDVVSGPSDASRCTGGATIGSGPFPSARTTLCARHDAQGLYNLCDANGNRTPASEGYDWQWYVTDGEFPDSGGVGNETDDHPDFVRPAGAFTMWVILRDGRGGVDWVRMDVP
jgi:hypothetical protein